MAPTENRIKRTKEDYELIAKEPLQVEYIKGTLYFYGSELACLRLFHKMPLKRTFYSQNLKTWVFAVDL